MKLQKSKKGSGLILVIMMFAFLSIVGMAFISMSLSSYKLRVAKANAKTGLYGAESGIDEVYGIIGNKVDESIKKGNNEVNLFMDKLSSDLINAKKKVHEQQQGNDYKSLSENDVKSIIDSIEKGNDYRYLEDIKDCIKVEKDTQRKGNENETYVKLYLDDNKVLESQNKIFKDKYTENILEIQKDEEYDDDEIVPLLKEISNCNFQMNKQKPEIGAKIIIDKVGYSKLEDIDKKLSELKKNKKIPIRINSKFQYKGTTKKVQADYIINIPPYNKSYYVNENNQIVHKNPLFTKAISINGNMYIDGTTNISGDVYVGGNEKKDKDKGIIINNKGNFNGNVVTAKDFKIKGVNAQCEVTGNVFANNVLLDKSATNSKLMINKKDKDKPGDVYTKDDLQIDALNSKTVINGAYYGLNNGDKSTEPGSSSSININAVENGKVRCKLDIQGKGSIIMGTAYTDFEKDDKKYQTGESVAVKGNYRAYSIPSNNSPFNEYIFEYYIPKNYKDDKNNNIIVGLVSKDKSSKELNVFEKSKYFEDIVKSNIYNSIFKWDGINVNGASCIHIGTIFKKNKDNLNVSSSSGKFTIDDLNKVFTRIKEFNKQVYNMGEEVNDIELLSDSKKSVDTQLDKIDNITESDDKNIVVVKKGDTKIIDGKLDGNDNLKINGKNALIIVNGDLTVNSNLDFKGTLIVTGNLKIENGVSLNITYNEDIIRNLISKNYAKLKHVFKNNSEEIFDTLNKTEFDTDGHSDIVLNKLIQMKNWKIVK